MTDDLLQLQRTVDEQFMRAALREAELAAAEGEVPVGAIVAHEGSIIAAAHNQRETLHDPTAHAEMIALTQAAASLGSWRLAGCTLYVTLEPCPMCAGAIVNARVPRVVYGATDPKAGAVESLYTLLADPRLNHASEVTRGILGEESGELLRNFFAAPAAIMGPQASGAPKGGGNRGKTEAGFPLPWGNATRPWLARLDLV